MGWPNAEVIDWVRQRICALQPDVVIANYFNAACVFEPGRTRYRKTILVHDTFALRKQSYEESGLPPDFDEGMVARELDAFRSSDLCLTITSDEARYIRQACPGVRAVVVPPMVDVRPRPHARSPEARCLFVGTDNDPNRRGLAWLLKEVWPRVIHRAPHATLRVVGNVCATDGLHVPPNVDLAGYAPDLEGEYRAAAVALVPLLAGSGLKVKLIEALAHGVPVVATRSGASGVARASTEFLGIHDDPGEFAKAIADMMSSSDWMQRSAAARSHAAEQYSQTAVGKVLQTAFLDR